MTHEQYLALDLVARLAGRFGASSKIAQELPGWLENLVSVECPERPRSGESSEWWTRVRRLAESLVPEPGGGEGAMVERNAALLGHHAGLTPLELRIFSFMVFHELFDGFEHVVNEAVRTREVTLPLLLAQSCGVDESEVRAALRPKGRLATSGLLHLGGSGRLQRVNLSVSDRICAALLAEVDDIEGLIGRLFPPAPAPEAGWEDFAGMAEDAVLLREVLGRALATRTRGVNILLYGPPGTGKTEFAKVLAGALGLTLRAVGETDSEGDEPTRRERLGELALAGRMLGTRQDTLLLFDEMEDVFGSRPFSAYDRPSKVHFNRLLESNPLPTIWTTNSIQACDPAYLRRMTHSVLMRGPTGPVRARIWRRLDARHGTRIAPDRLAEMAERHDQPPALVADAMRTMRLVGGGPEMVARLLEAAGQLAAGGVAPAPRTQTEAPWSPALSTTETDLVRLEQRLLAPGAARRVSFLVEGPPGTGKSAWARHLAQRLGLPVWQMRASDLLSKWVGGSEKAISRAFAEARAEGAMLIFDEADSLLADRRGAQRSWEVSQVNEMLTWMETHPLPFVCTTNLSERLDPATQRRFTFRFRFGWLTSAQLPTAWTMYFDAPPPVGLALLDQLSPGDFANVARRMQALGEADAAEILRELRRECEAKDGEARRIGFGR